MDTLRVGITGIRVVGEHDFIDVAWIRLMFTGGIMTAGEGMQEFQRATHPCGNRVPVEDISNVRKLYYTIIT